MLALDWSAGPESVIIPADSQGRGSVTSVLSRRVGGMLVVAQFLISLVSLLGALSPKLIKVYFRQVDDVAWVEKNGALLIEQTSVSVGGAAHEEMKREIRLGIERDQIRKFVLSRLKYPVFPAYVSAGVSLVFMLLPAVLGLGSTSPRFAAALLMLAGTAALILTVFSVRNALLNIEISASLRDLVAAGNVHYPIDRSDLRRRTLRVCSLNARQLWREARKTLMDGRTEMNKSSSRGSARRRTSVLKGERWLIADGPEY